MDILNDVLGVIKMNVVFDIQKKINLVILFVFFFFVTNKAVIAIWQDLFSNGMNIWVYTDWLVNYSAGFVRRGLSGEFISQMRGMVAPKTMAIVFSWGIFFGMCACYFYLIARNIKKIPPLYLIVVLFLPSSILFYIFDHAALGRKETLGFLLVFLHLFFVQGYVTKGSEPGSYIKKLSLLTILLLPMHILIHEASLFLFVPLHLMISWSVLSSVKDSVTPKRVITLLLCYSPVLLSFLVVFFWGRPEFSLVKELCLNLEQAGALNPRMCSQSVANKMWALPGALTALPWTFSEAITLPASLSKEVIMIWLLEYGVLAFIAMSYLSRLSTVLSVGDAADENNAMYQQHGSYIRLKYFLLPFFCTLPLYVMGWDFGRWFAVTCVNFGLISLSRELGILEMRTLSQQGVLFEKLSVLTNSIKLGRAKMDGALAIMLVIICFYYLRVPHCCIKENNFTFVAEPLKTFIHIMLK